MAQITERAIVLRSYPLRESDLLLTLLAEETGKLTAVARGARRSKKRFLGGVDIFDCGKAVLQEPRSANGMYTLELLQPRQSWHGLLHSLESLSLAAFCLELCDALTADGDPEGGALFRPLYFSLRRLDESAELKVKLSIASFCTLECLRISGFDVLNELSSSPSCLWFRQMLQDRQPTVLNCPDTCRTGVIALIQFAERTVERPMLSAPEVRQLTASL